MARQPRKPKTPLGIEDLVHNEAKRKNIPTVEHQSVMQHHEQAPVKVAYPRANRQWLEELCAVHDAGKASPEFQQRLNRDLDPQLIWRGKDQQDWSDLVVNAPPLYIQEKVKPKVLIDDLRRQTEEQRAAAAPQQDSLDLFGDFNGLPEGADRTEFYQHEGHWQNRMILGDSLQVMASLAEREGLRGMVQCIYFDPPYGIKFNSNFQWSTTSRDVKDGNAGHITREPEQVKAFRDTWRDGIHSYLTYLRDRLMVARDLLTESGSIFVQIGDENVHRVRAVMDEVFGDENFVNMIFVQKSGGFAAGKLDSIGDYVLWYAKSSSKTKTRQLFDNKSDSKSGLSNYPYVQLEDYRSRGIAKEEKVNPDKIPLNAKLYGIHSITSARSPGAGDVREFIFEGRTFNPGTRTFTTDIDGLNVLTKAGRLKATPGRLGYVRYFDDFSAVAINNNWNDTRGDMNMMYIVQTSTKGHLE